MDKPKTAMQIIGVNINFLMFKKNISSWDLAEKVGLSRQTIHSYRTGKSVPRLDDAVKIAKALDVDIKALLEGIEEDSDPSRWHDMKDDPPQPMRPVLVVGQDGRSNILKFDPEQNLWLTEDPYLVYKADYVVRWYEPVQNAEG